MEMNTRVSVTVLFALLLALAASASAQGTTGSIGGTVSDSTGAVIPGARVEVISIGNTAGYRRVLASNGFGRYFLPELLPGDYEITAAVSGFESSSVRARVVVDSSAEVNFVLRPGDQRIEVDVPLDSSVQVDLSQSNLDTNITKRVVSELPDVTFSTLLELAPNVRKEDLSDGFQIDGASGAENVFVIDGQEVTNFAKGTLDENHDLSRPLVQEVQVKSTGFNAEYGGATGGVINVVTVGGNNDWHGEFGISFSPSSWSGDPRPILSQFGAGPGEVEFFSPNKDGGTDFFPVASVNGPIIRDKLWFSTIYAPRVRKTSRTIDYFDTNLPSRTVEESITYDSTETAEQALFRLDSQPGERFRFFATYLWNPVVNDGHIPAIAEGLTGSPQEYDFGGSTGFRRGAELLALRGGRQSASMINGQFTWAVTDSVFVSFRLGRSFLNQRLNANGVPEATRYVCEPGLLAGTTPGSNCVDGFVSYSGVPPFDRPWQTRKDVSTRTTFDADAIIAGVQAAGTHTLKFGYQFNRLFSDLDRGYWETGDVHLLYGLSLDDLVGLPSTKGNLGSGFMVREWFVGRASSRNTALYAQDSWQIGSRLTLNLGIRFENEFVPNYGDESTTKVLQFGWGDKIAPRLGFAFDITGDGKTKVFGSFGRFYDRFKYELPLYLFGANNARVDYFEILPTRGAAYSNYTIGSILGTNPDVPGGMCPIEGGTGWSVCQFDYGIPFNLEDTERLSLDPAIKPTSQSEYTFGIEREFGEGLVGGLRFTQKKLDRVVEDATTINDQGSPEALIGNPGFGAICDLLRSGNLPCTKAERKYDVLEFRLDSRSSRHFLSVNYAWSRLSGNFSGLVGTDETDRGASPNISRSFDFPIYGYDADGNPDNGPLPTDRPHTFKAYGGYAHDWTSSGTHKSTISGFFTIRSGTPLTTQYTIPFDSYPFMILNGRGDLGRTEVFSQTDVRFTHRYAFGRDKRYRIEPYLEVINLFDERNELRRNTTISNAVFGPGSLSDLGCTTCGDFQQLFETVLSGSGIRQFVQAYLDSEGVSPVGIRNDFNLPVKFQAPRLARFGVRFEF